MPKKKSGVRTGDARLAKTLSKALQAEGIKKRKAVRVANAVSESLGRDVPAGAGPTAEPQAAQVPTPARAPEPEPASTSQPEVSGDSYDGWTKADLLARARTVNLSGRATMSKGQLLEALRASEHAGA
jgi:hypothetical protein